MQEGADRLAAYQLREAALHTESGGRNASLARPVIAGEVDVTMAESSTSRTCM